MKTYVIERDLPEIGKSSKETLEAIASKSCEVLDNMNPNEIQWVRSYVAENKIYCIYKSTDTQLLKDHAEKGGFPLTSISEVTDVIGPETAKTKV